MVERRITLKRQEKNFLSTLYLLPLKLLFFQQAFIFKMVDICAIVHHLQKCGVKLSFSIQITRFFVVAFLFFFDLLKAFPPARDTCWDCRSEPKECQKNPLSSCVQKPRALYLGSCACSCFVEYFFINFHSRFHFRAKLNLNYPLENL